MNYLVCTANLGVVPLFLLAAFLFAPIALFFALRRFSVTAVLEAIYISLINKLDISKFKNLTITLLFVKVILSQCIAKSPPPDKIDLILAQGEQKEIEIKQLSKLSIGNRAILTHRYLSKTKKILIKGKQVGFSDLIFWDGKIKKIYHVYVLSKQKFLKTYQLAETLKDLNLTIDIKGPIMSAGGEINNFADYLYLHKIKEQYKDQIFFKITLNKKLKDFITSKIYEILFNNGFQSIYCQNEWLILNCFYNGDKNKKLIEQLKNDYKINFIQQESQFKQKNFTLKLKLFQIERSDGKEIQLGFDKLEASVSKIFDFGLKKLIEDNIVFLQKSNLEISTLAEPELVVNLDTPQSIEIGSEIPYQTIKTANQQVIAPVEWKFAGLKITTKFKDHFGKIKLTYQTEFTRPMGEAINGSKEKSSAIIEPGSQIKLFKIGYKTTGKSKTGIPFLTDIPILKHLFESKTDVETFKEIHGFLSFEEI